MFLKECKYVKKKVIRQIIKDLESSSDDSIKSDSNFENTFFEDTILKILLK